MSSAADDAGRAWARAARELASDLPGSWELSGGRPSLRTMLVRQPVGWAVGWVAVDRKRVSDPVRVGVGVTALVEPVLNLSHRWGLASDTSPWRARFDLTASDAYHEVEAFVLEHGIPKLDHFTPELFSTSAEAAVAKPDPDQRFATLTQAAGWRVVDDTGSPVEPARLAADRYRSMDLADEVAWYDALVGAYERGGRDAALA